MSGPDMNLRSLFTDEAWVTEPLVLKFRQRNARLPYRYFQTKNIKEEEVKTIKWKKREKGNKLPLIYTNQPRRLPPPK